LAGLALAACASVRVVPAAVLPRADVPGALALAEAAFAGRPDAGAVERALALFESAAASDPSDVEGPVGAVRSAAWLLERPGTPDRARLVASVLGAAGQCQRRAPGTARCDYWEAVGRGLAAREQPTTGLAELPRIVALFRRAEAAQPALEEGGPSRALALLLLKAPGWPLGPGDPEAALEAARRAEAVAPEHPLNQLALAEALSATGDESASRASYARARDLAVRRLAAGDPDGAAWAAQAGSPP
jgi:tetratricopeptide (TPR) repeat protein